MCLSLHTSAFSLRHPFLMLICSVVSGFKLVGIFIVLYLEVLSKHIKHVWSPVMLSGKAANIFFFYLWHWSLLQSLCPQQIWVTSIFVVVWSLVIDLSKPESHDCELLLCLQITNQLINYRPISPKKYWEVFFLEYLPKVSSVFGVLLM